MGTGHVGTSNVGAVAMDARTADAFTTHIDFCFTDIKITRDI